MSSFLFCKQNKINQAIKPKLMKPTTITLLLCILISSFSSNNVENGKKEEYDTITIKSLESYEEKIRKEDDYLLRAEGEEGCKYVNKTGKIVIKAKYSGAYPFENGKAKVSENCLKEQVYYSWKGGEWYFIDYCGEIVQ